jgi:hypothetical protein
LSIFIAVERFLCWDRSAEHLTTMPVGMWVMLDGRLGLVDVLSALAASAHRLDLEVLLLDVDVDVVIDLGDDGHGGEGRLPTGLGVEGADADEPMDAVLRLEVAVGVLAADGDGGVLDACLVPRLPVEELDLEASPLAPPAVHPEEDLGPVLGVDAAGAGVDGEDGVEAVLRTVEHSGQLGLPDELLELGDPTGDLGHHLLVLAGRELEELAELAHLRGELVQAGDLGLQGAALLHDLLGRVGVVPEAFLGGLIVQAIELTAHSVEVKDTSPAHSGAVRGHRDGCVPRQWASTRCVLHSPATRRRRGVPRGEGPVNAGALAGPQRSKA